MVIAICVSLIMLYGACITGSAIKFGLGEEELPASRVQHLPGWFFSRGGQTADIAP
jgi:hypothetical protein